MKKLNKEELFKNYVSTALEAFWNYQSYFGSEGVLEKLAGIGGIHDDQDKLVATEHIKKSWAWEILSSLYEYAVHGIASPIETNAYLVCCAEEIINYVDNGIDGLHRDWTRILAQADGRLALDDGDDLLIDKVAGLASVDVRTVRNAISAGELVAEKRNRGVYVQNKSARKWLIGRRGFKPTVQALCDIGELKEIKSASEFGIFLSNTRENIGQSLAGKTVSVFHPLVSVDALKKIENGVFDLPLDTCFPIADFYQIDRGEFLQAVMNVFYNDELIALEENKDGDES